MSETVQHETLQKDPSLAVTELLSQLDLQSLSFVQLRRLQKTFQQAAEEIDREISRRAEDDNSGDTVKVQSPNA